MHVSTRVRASVCVGGLKRRERAYEIYRGIKRARKEEKVSGRKKKQKKTPVLI